MQYIHGQVVVCWQCAGSPFYGLAVVWAGSVYACSMGRRDGMNTVRSMGWRLCACVVFYRLVVVGL